LRQQVDFRGGENGVDFHWKQENRKTGDLNQINDLGTEGFFFQGDITNELTAQELIKSSINKFGSLDIVINNVGEYFDGDEWNMDSKAWENTLKTNLLSMLNVSKYAGLYFQENQKGVFVNMASVRGYKSLPDAITYGASKAGVINITQSYSKMLAPFGRANSISPGIVNTGYWLRAPQEELIKEKEGILMQRLIEPEEVADLALFLASDKSSMITGQNIVIDGGYIIK